MFDAIVEAALKYRLAVVGTLVAIIVFGGLAFKRLPIEAYPDVADVSVQIISQWPGHAAEEVEREISIPIEVEMNGVPRKTHLRSTSIFGLSVVTLIFEDGTDMFFARQQVTEKLAKAQVPSEAKPSLGPLASPIGEILRYTLKGQSRPIEELKLIEDYTVERALRSVPGVADVISFGGPSKQYQVFVKPERLVAYGIDVNDVAEAISRSNRNAGGGAIEVGPQSINVRGQGLIANPDEIRNISIRTDEKGTPVRVRDVAEVDIGHAPRLGVVGIGEDDDVVQATILMRRGENAADILTAVRTKIQELNTQGLMPAGVQIVPYYDRAKLIDSTTHTVIWNMVEGITLVAGILFLFLGNIRTATIVALSIPIALLIAFIGMDAIGLPANLLSIGAVDFGMVVEGTVITVEHVFTQLAAAGEAGEGASRLSRIRRAAKEVARPMAFSVAIITVAYLPIFTLERVEGKLFRPMAFTVAFALIGSLFFALTAAPVLASYLLKGHLKEFESPLLKWRKTLYPKALRWALGHRILVLGFAGAVAAGGVFLAGKVGSEFLPHLDEGAIWARATMPPNISLPESRALVNQMRRVFVKFPEVETVTSQAGRPDDGTDPTGFYNGEFYVALKPREQWRKEFGGDKEHVIEAMAKELEQFPGIAFGFSQPIADNVEEATSGVKGQLAVKIYGTDLEVLEKLATDVGREVERVKGVSDFAVLRQLGQTNLSISIDRSRAGQAGVDIEDVEDAIEAGVGGRVVTQIVEGEKRIDLVVRMAETARGDIDALRRLGVGTHQRRLVPIGQVADLTYVTGASRIVREDNARYAAIKFGVRDRDLGSVVADAQANVAKAVKLPEGYRMVWSGEFESQRRANARLAMILPVTLVGLTILLIGALKSPRDAVILLFNVLLTSPPGGLLALYLAGTHFSVSAGVGFLALFGVSIQAGILLVDRIARLRREGEEVDEAIVKASVSTARPIALTGLVATFGLLPAALSHGIGSDAQRPLAIVVVGGLAGCLVLSLVILPTLYRSVIAFWPDKVVSVSAAPPSMPSGRLSSPAHLATILVFLTLGALGLTTTAARADEPARPAVAVTPAAASSVAPRAPDTATPITLERALALFREQNLELLAAKHDLSAVRAQVIAAGLLQNPTLSAGAVVMVHGVPTGGEQQLSIQIEQVIPLGGQLAARRNVAERLAGAAEMDFAAVFYRLASDVRDAYLAVQVAEARRKIVMQGLTDFDRIETIVASRVAAGANAQYDRMRADVELSRWRSRLAEADSDVIDARTRLARAIGATAGSAPLAAGEAIAEPPELRTDTPAAVTTALAQRPEIAAERRRAEALEARIGQVKKEFVPSPSVNVGYTPWFNVPTADGYKGGGAVMAGVSIPLPIWDHGQGTVQRAEAEALAARARRDATERGVALEVDQAVRTLAVRVAAWREHRDVAVASASRMRQMADAAYREGKLGILELVDAYNSLLAASETALDLEASAWSAARTLERALGPAPTAAPAPLPAR